MPLAADPQQEMWYPVALVCKAIGNFNLLVISAYFIAACTTYAFVLHETKSKLSATLSGITYALCGFMAAHLGHTAMIHAAAWIPLLLLAISKLKSGFQATWFSVGQIGIACCFLGGHSQIFILELIIGGTYSIFTAIRSGKNWLQLLITYSLLFALGVGLSALQFVPTSELARASTRKSITYDTFASFSLPPKQLVEIFFPFICFAPPPSGAVAYGQSPYFGAWNTTELCGYAGILPFILSLVALLDRKADKSKWFFLFLAASGLLAAAGDDTPLGKVLYAIPVINYFRCPGRFVLLFDLAVSVLAGAGLSALQKLPDTRSRLRLITTSSLITAALMSLSYGRSIKYLNAHYKILSTAPLSLSPLSNIYVGLPLLLFFAAFVILVVWCWKPGIKGFTIVLILVTIADLSSCAAFSEWKFKIVTADLLQPSLSISQQLSALKDPQFRLIAPFGTGAEPTDCSPNIPSLWNVSSVLFYSPLETARSAAFFEDGGTGTTLHACAYTDTSLDLASARYFVIPNSLRSKFEETTTAEESTAGGSNKRFSLLSAPDAKPLIFENKRALARFRFVENAVVLSAGEALRVIKKSRFQEGKAFDPVTTALVEEKVSTEKKADIEKIALLDAPSGQIILSTERDRKGLLVIADQYFKGWTCTIDSEPAKIIRANYAFKAVLVPAGKHLVKFEFRPQSFSIGLTISIVSILVTIAAGAYKRLIDIRRNSQFSPTRN